MSDEELLARVRLNHAVEPGDIKVADAVAAVGPVGALDMVLSDERRPALADRARAVDPDRVLAVARHQGIRFVTPDDDEWPAQLDDLGHGQAVQSLGGIPVGLWVRGPMSLAGLADSVAVVGARSATTYGFHVATDLAADLVRSSVPIVSGGAFGIDVAAHRGALAADGITVAVLACGVDRAYPVAHRELIDHLARHHAVISEAPLGSSPTKVRFLSRNRLIAGLTRGTVVVEAAIRSGALNTAHWADQLSRVLMGVPGPVTSATSQGVHNQIRMGHATLVASGADVLELVGAPGEHLLPVPRGPSRPHDALGLHEVRVLDAVPVGQGASSESIGRIAGVSRVEADQILWELARSGLVSEEVDGWRLARRDVARQG